ncbi:MAG: hypothetical protein KDD48_07165, partial [Bdellovibrionales bacterium]|nr:hypothetical protein [Bdellovibrionales bacterium]
MKHFSKTLAVGSLCIFAVLLSACSKTKSSEDENKPAPKTKQEVVVKNPPSKPDGLAFSNGTLAWSGSTDKDASGNSTPQNEIDYLIFVYTDANKKSFPKEEAYAKTTDGSTTQMIQRVSIPSGQTDVYVVVIAVDPDGLLSKPSDPIKIHIQDIPASEIQPTIDGQDFPVSESDHTSINSPVFNGKPRTPRQSGSSYIPKEDTNCHDVADWPTNILRERDCDNLGMLFTLNQEKQKFYIIRWDPKKLPITFTFHESAKDSKYDKKRKWVREVVDHMNAVAKKENLTSGEFFHLNNEIDGFNTDDVVDYSHTIRFDDSQTMVNPLGLTAIYSDLKTGEILDADVILYVNRIDHVYGQLREATYENAFKHVTIHEFLHAAGLEHNFMGHPYRSQVSLSREAEYQNWKLQQSLGSMTTRQDYDRATLHYGYTDNTTKNDYANFSLLRVLPHSAMLGSKVSESDPQTEGPLPQLTDGTVDDLLTTPIDLSQVGPFIGISLAEPGGVGTQAVDPNWQKPQDDDQGTHFGPAPEGSSDSKDPAETLDRYPTPTNLDSYFKDYCNWTNGGPDWTYRDIRVIDAQYPSEFTDTDEDQFMASIIAKLKDLFGEQSLWAVLKIGYGTKGISLSRDSGYYGLEGDYLKDNLSGNTTYFGDPEKGEIDFKFKKVLRKTGNTLSPNFFSSDYDRLNIENHSVEIVLYLSRNRSIAEIKHEVNGKQFVINWTLDPYCEKVSRETWELKRKQAIAQELNRL